MVSKIVKRGYLFFVANRAWGVLLRRREQKFQWWRKSISVPTVRSKAASSEAIDHVCRQVITSATDRLDLKLEQDQKDTVARATAISSTTVAAFVLLAAKDKASDMTEREHHVWMSAAEFRAFSRAFNQPIVPNSALTKGMQSARKVKRA